jgi:hypothetical protein
MIWAPPYAPQALPPAYPPGAFGAYPPPQIPTTKLRSVGAMVAGIVLVSAGLTAALIDTPLLQPGDQTCVTNGHGFACSTREPGPGPVVLAVLGVAGMVAGLPLILYGAWGVPAHRASTGAARGLPSWAGAPTGNGWRWSF